jgi:hypothetical protein
METISAPVHKLREMPANDDIFDAALHIERDRFAEGMAAGRAAGELLGYEEGRATGVVMGAEIGRELGFYLGCVDVWMPLATRAAAAATTVAPVAAAAAAAAAAAVADDAAAPTPSSSSLQDNSTADDDDNAAAAPSSSSSSSLQDDAPLVASFPPRAVKSLTKLHELLHTFPHGEAENERMQTRIQLIRAKVKILLSVMGVKARFRRGAHNGGGAIVGGGTSAPSQTISF